MRACLRTMTWLALGGIAATGCGTSRLCDGTCPLIGDTFAIQATTLSGACDFTPPILPPSVTLIQSSDRQRVSFGLVDPANQVPITLTAEVRVPDRGAAIATFEVVQRSLRQASLRSDKLLDLQLSLTGAITESGGRRRLEGVLTTVDLDGGCATTTTFVGTGSLVAPRP